MKIAIASNDGIRIADHFGRTRGFVFYEVENGQIHKRMFRVNKVTGHARGLNSASPQAEHHGPVLSVLKDCQAVISRGMGRRMYDDLRAAGIEPFIVQETETDKALKHYLTHSLIDYPEKGCAH